MQFEYTPKVKEMQAKLLAFFDQYIYPNEKRFHEEINANRQAGNAWVPSKLIEELKPKAREAGLWNLFLPRSPRAPQACRTSNTRPCAKSWAGCPGRPKSSTAPRPTPATWKRWSATRPRH